MKKKIKVNVIREKVLINKNGNKFYITEVKPKVVFILDKHRNFICQYCGSIDEDDDNMDIINNH